MIDKTIFFNNIKLFLASFGLEFSNEEDLKLYCSSCYMVFEEYKINQQDFINAVKNSVKSLKSKDFKRRPAPLDLLEKLQLINEQKDLSIEEVAALEFDKIIKYLKCCGDRSFNDTTLKVLNNYYTNGIDSIDYMLFDPFNQSKKDLIWCRREFIDYYTTEALSLNGKKLNQAIENKSKKNLELENSIKNLVANLTTF